MMSSRASSRGPTATRGASDFPEFMKEIRPQRGKQAPGGRRELVQMLERTHTRGASVRASGKPSELRVLRFPASRGSTGNAAPATPFDHTAASGTRVSRAAQLALYARLRGWILPGAQRS